MRVTAVVGAQFGSEGKGMIVEKIADRYNVHVRTGAPNAGHTYFIDPPERKTPGRVKVVARSVPVGACNLDANLVIGPGALIDLALLLAEVETLDTLGLQVSERLIVDGRAMLIDPVRHHAYEGGVGGYAHERIGSTGEGVGPARMGRIARQTYPIPGPAWAHIDQVQEWESLLTAKGITVRDTAAWLNDAYDAGASILLEGTQGSGLSLIHGPWPYVTSSDTNAAQLAVDAGLAPGIINDVILVARTFPIRVAGNSGPLPNELDWEIVGQPAERTTVTRKERRVADFDVDTVRRAVMLNRPSRMALTFVDYVWRELAGKTDARGVSAEFAEWLAVREREVGVPIEMLGTGPDSMIEVIRPKIIGRIRKTWPTLADALGVPA